ncbi:carboxypeptidase-like regulatory domain-containing protein [Halopiger aswanensis]|uniref:Carboxypeptidase family protein n=1 Tax=Halopiger aswanensis TaxID=148449 RepID=A0A419W0X8_9EURY|nr:carboxypeptidase-like regulatory domain-containing protein [Halopiger aswanensis]RKD89131.1 carboxypeptidase family protein [Halopiger aswanensis]
MSRNARSENAKMRSIQRSVQVFLIVAGIGLLVAGLALAASGASVGDAVDTISEKWSDQTSTETGTDTTADGGGATDDEDGNNESDESDADGSDSTSGESDAGNETDDADEGAADGTDDTDSSAGGDESDVEDNESAVGGETNESADTHTLTVTADNESGDPVENATVAVDAMDAGNSLHNETTTGGNGEAEFDLEDGEYNVTVSADGYEDAQETVEISGEDEDVALTLASDQEQDESDTDGTDGTDDDAADNESSTLTVFVVDGDGNPVENATVEATESGLFGDSHDNETNADGEAEFDLEDGEYDLTVSADGYDDAQDTVEINGEDEEVLLMLEESG